MYHVQMEQCQVGRINVKSSLVVIGKAEKQIIILSARSAVEKMKLECENLFGNCRRYLND